MEVSAYSGACGDQNICVNSEGQEGDWSKGSPSKAFCIRTDTFVAPADEKLMDFSGATFTTLLTSPDMKTQLMGAKVDVETEVSSPGDADRPGANNECMQYLSLTTDRLEINTTSIELSETRAIVRALALSLMTGVRLIIILVL